MPTSRCKTRRRGAQVANFRKVVITAIAEVDNGLTTYDAECRRLDDLQQAIDQAQQALHLATQRDDRGIIDYLNVLDAERPLYQLQDEQAISENTAVNDFVDVCQSLGGGWEGFAPPPVCSRPRSRPSSRWSATRPAIRIGPFTR